MAKILIVDDEPRIRELIRENLQYSGYTCEEAGDGSAALSLLTGGGYDLVILDLMMPFMDGMTCLREMRTRRINTPVIILTARGEEYDKLAGLEGGADDYVVKPFSPRELVARVKAVLNRTMPRTEASDSTMTFGELSIDTASHTVKVSGEEVSLTPKEFDLLVFLASNKGIALSREKILQKVWNYHCLGHRLQVRPRRGALSGGSALHAANEQNTAHHRHPGPAHGLSVLHLPFAGGTVLVSEHPAAGAPLHHPYPEAAHRAG